MTERNSDLFNLELKLPFKRTRKLIIDRIVTSDGSDYYVDWFGDASIYTAVKSGKGCSFIYDKPETGIVYVMTSEKSVGITILILTSSNAWDFNAMVSAQPNARLT